MIEMLNQFENNPPEIVFEWNDALRKAGGLEVVASSADVPFADAEIFYGPICEYADSRVTVIPISSPTAAWHARLHSRCWAMWKYPTRQSSAMFRLPSVRHSNAAMHAAARLRHCPHRASENAATQLV